MIHVRPVLASVAAVAAVLAVDGAPARAADPVMYVIGDSWSAGLHADPEHTLAQDAAEDLGLRSVVDAESGTGYLTAPSGTRTFVERAAEIPTAMNAELVVIQGGSNDDGRPVGDLRRAVSRAVAAVHRAVPRARVVLLGPGPDPWPITPQQTDVDTALRRTAVVLGVPYVSPMAERWFTAANVDSIIDPVTHHPTVAGDEELGARLSAALRTVQTDARTSKDRAVR